MEGIIYKYTNKINGKVYIGQTIDEERRKRNHIKCADDSYFHRAIKKYGFENFTYEVLEKIDKSLLNEREIYWISYYDSNNSKCGYNLTIGGDGSKGYHYTDEQRARRSEQLKGNTIWLGKKHSEEYKMKMSELHKGKTLSEETKRKIGDANRGNKAMLGKHHSEESKMKMSEVRKTKHIVTKGTTGMKWKLVDGKRIFYRPEI